MTEQEKYKDESMSACNVQNEEKLRNEPAESPYQAQKLLHWSTLLSAGYPAGTCISFSQKTLRNFH